MRFSKEERASQGSTRGSRIAELLATWSRLVSCQVARSSSTWSSTLFMLAAWAAQRGSGMLAGCLSAYAIVHGTGVVYIGHSAVGACGGLLTSSTD